MDDVMAEPMTNREIKMPVCDQCSATCGKYQYEPGKWRRPACIWSEVERLHADRKTQDRVLARLNEQVPALVAEIERLQKALQTIADYERPRQATSAWPVITTLQNTARQAL